MRKKYIYSFELTHWVESYIPTEIIQAMLNHGWNVFGIYELVKEGFSLERKGNLTSRSSRAAECCAKCVWRPAMPGWRCIRPACEHYPPPA